MYIYKNAHIHLEKNNIDINISKMKIHEDWKHSNLNKRFQSLVLNEDKIK